VRGCTWERDFIRSEILISGEDPGTACSRAQEETGSGCKIPPVSFLLLVDLVPVELDRSFHFSNAIRPNLRCGGIVIYTR